MGALPNNNDPRSSFVCREQSLRGAFASMHRSNSHLTPRSASPRQADFGNHQQQQQQHEVANDDCGGSLERRHRCSHRHATTVSLPISAPPLPFGKDGKNEEPSTAAQQPLQAQESPLRRREPSPSILRPLKRFQRRSSAITAGMAQEMVHHLSLDQIERKSKERETRERQRRPTVACGLPNEKQQLDESPASYNEDQGQEVNKHQHNGFRIDYQLGETVRCTSHMMREQESSVIDSLNRYDFAFVKRSDGSFSYAILAQRTLEPIKSSSENSESANTTDVEECMVFVMNQSGSTKMIRMRHWADKVRLPSSQQEDEEAIYESTENVLLCQEIAPKSVQQGELVKKLSLLPPTVITFNSLQILDDDDCSFMSSVSDRARASQRREEKEKWFSNS